MDMNYCKTLGRSYYEDTIERFVAEGNPSGIVDFLTESAEEDDESLPLQKGAWRNQINILKRALAGKKGFIVFEYIISRLNSRIDVVLLMDGIVYSLEFKNNEVEFLPDDINQADGYGYALKNFHLASRDRLVAPLLIATRAPNDACSTDSDLIGGLFSLFKTNPEKMMAYIDAVSAKYGGKQEFTEETFKEWITSPFKASPTIIESAQAIYTNNRVKGLWMFDAGEENLSTTEKAVSDIVQEAREKKKKIICFVTGVPGAGKTLVGLDLAGKSRNSETNIKDSNAIFFSGNGPLIAVLTSQLGRDAQEQNPEKYPNLNRAIMDVKSFIQDLHAYKDSFISTRNPVPEESILIFDEAQRVWDAKQMNDKFFLQKDPKRANMGLSEADLLIDTLKPKEWAVIVALVGLGQDINDGENGIRTWFESLLGPNKDWEIRFSHEIFDQNADQLGDLKQKLLSSPNVKTVAGLHLKTTLRTPRARNMSQFAEALLENRPDEAVAAMKRFDNYPIYVTRDYELATQWLENNRKRKERMGVMYSSNASNFKHEFKCQPIPIGRGNKAVADWFIDKTGAYSSNALVYCASEFDVQGLEIDWELLLWNMDMYYDGNQWHQQRIYRARNLANNISGDVQKKHILNSYRVLLTRARKGLVIYIPRRSWLSDQCGITQYLDTTFEYLKSCGIAELPEIGPKVGIERRAIELPF